MWVSVLEDFVLHWVVLFCILGLLLVLTVTILFCFDLLFFPCFQALKKSDATKTYSHGKRKKDTNNKERLDTAYLKFNNKLIIHSVIV